MHGVSDTVTGGFVISRVLLTLSILVPRKRGEEGLSKAILPVWQPMLCVLRVL